MTNFMNIEKKKKKKKKKKVLLVDIRKTIILLKG